MLNAVFSRRHYGLFLLISLLHTNSSHGKETSFTNKVELGRYLFHDVRLSLNGKRSCALCHNPDEGWSNTFSKVPDINGQLTNINTPSILNSVFHSNKSMKDPSVVHLEQAIEKPLLSTDPLEMGMTKKLIVERLNEASTLYTPLFLNAFGTPEMSYQGVINALTSFVSAISSLDTNYHQYLAGDNARMDASALVGLSIFNKNCVSCHSGKLLNITLSSGKVEFYNTGMYGIKNKYGAYWYPENENGIRQVTGKIEDDGKYRTPSLINVVHTGPWGHDGSFSRLEDVIDHYSKGGRTVYMGNNAGNGERSEAKHLSLTGFSITNKEKKHLLHFLSQLSINNQNELANSAQSPFCQLIKLRNKQDTPNCIPPYRESTL